MIQKTLLALTTIGLFSSANFSRATEATFESKVTKTHLLELFTSEGCSSCPPAEAWLSKLKDEPRLWQDFVPLAFHVDYWDNLGWRDPFASKAWTARQYDYSTRWKSSSVYTPGFVLDGREWRREGIPSAANEAAGVLKIALTTPDGVNATFTPIAGGNRSFEVHIARLGFGLQTNVQAGENSGRKLLHDFVVLSLAKQPLTGGRAEIRLGAGAKESIGGRQAIAAWVTEAGQSEPIQTVGGWL